MEQPEGDLSPNNQREEDPLLPVDEIIREAPREEVDFLQRNRDTIALLAAAGRWTVDNKDKIADAIARIKELILSKKIKEKNDPVVLQE
jgi:hypothetical protein